MPTGWDIDYRYIHTDNTLFQFAIDLINTLCPYSLKLDEYMNL